MFSNYWRKKYYRLLDDHLRLERVALKQLAAMAELRDRLDAIQAEKISHVEYYALDNIINLKDHRK